MTPDLTGDDNEAHPIAQGLLSRQPLAVLVGLSALTLVFVGWAAVHDPIPAAFATALWAVFLLRAPIARAMRRGPSQTPVAVETAGPPREDGACAWALIGADLTMEGRLTGAMLVEVHGRLAGEVRCDTMLVRPGGELHGHVACQSIGVPVDALFEGVVTPLASPPVQASRKPRSAPARRQKVEAL